MRLIGHLPLLTYPDAVSLPATHAALQMAAAMKADVDATIYSVDLPASGTSIAGLVIGISDMIRKVENDSRDHAASLTSAMQQFAQAAGLGIKLETRSASPAGAREGAVEKTRYCDMAVLPWEMDNLTAREVAEAVIFGSGRPTLIVPAGHQATDLRHIAIAWDGSRVAARALADARPFLTEQTEITVLTVDDEKRLEPGIGERLAESLKRRGNQARCHVLSTKGEPIAHALQETSRSLGAGLLVMGGYGHSRLRDFVMGGATQGVLANLTLPVLMSH